MKKWLTIVELLGLALVCAGLYFIYPPLTLIVVGLCMITVANVRKP